jgi:ribose/xylose/arabinose/galactoside ABC-type transport system permease subunit
MPSASRIASFLLLGNKAIIFAIVLIVALSLASPAFLTFANIFDVLRQSSVATVVALAFTLVLAGAEIDLSVGSIVGLVGIVMGKLMADLGWPPSAAIPVGLAAGVACGALNAALISYFALPAFIVTLATASLFRGIIYLSTNMVPISTIPPEFMLIGQGRLGIVPYPVIVMAAVAVVVFVIANRSIFGRHVLAIGANPEAARVAGISIRRVRLGIFALSGLCCGIGAVILTGRTASAQIGAGINMEMDVIAAVVIGGTPLFGGKANVFGTVVGCLTIGLISNGLNLIGVNSNFQIISKGLLILLALMVDVGSTRFHASLAKRRAVIPTLRDGARSPVDIKRASS